jgi:hypothetical protein
MEAVENKAISRKRKNCLGHSAQFLCFVGFRGQSPAQTTGDRVPNGRWHGSPEALLLKLMETSASELTTGAFPVWVNRPFSSGSGPRDE